MELFLKIIIQAIAGLTFVFLWKVDFNGISFLRFMGGWVLGATLLSCTDAIITIITN